MSKVFEALGNAREQAWWRDVQGEVDALRSVAARPAVSMPGLFAEVNMGEEMVRLHQHLDALLPGDAHRVIQFIGSREGEGTSTVVHEFARVAATQFSQRVLLLEMDRHAHTRGPRRVGPDGGAAEFAPSQVGDTTWYIAPLPRDFTAVSHTTDPGGPRASWERLRQDYDLVLVDSPPAATSAEGFAISRQVDGVILVLEAEETRWPVVERVKESVERSGGRVLGIVFNKRRYHIPGFIYRRL